jgi:hypothetical protein
MIVKVLTAVKSKAMTAIEEFDFLVYKVFESTAKAKTTRDEVDSYAVPLFQSMKFFENKNFTDGLSRVIEHPKYAYLALDAEGNNPKLDYYYYFLQLEHIKHGYSFSDNLKRCPALIAEEKQQKAENNLLEYMKEKIIIPE